MLITHNSDYLYISSKKFLIVIIDSSYVYVSKVSVDGIYTYSRFLIEPCIPFQNILT